MPSAANTSAVTHTVVRTTLAPAPQPSLIPTPAHGPAEFHSDPRPEYNADGDTVRRADGFPLAGAERAPDARADEHANFATDVAAQPRPIAAPHARAH